MILYASIVFFSFSVFSLHATNFTVDEYVDYIVKYIGFTSSYNLPTDNSALMNTSDSIVQDYGSFDFIIIGGGAAGTLVAKRLSEVSSFNILLLEAGETEDDFTNVPALNYYLRTSPMNWGYFTKPQKNSCQGMADNRCVYPIGKVLGGSCVLGDMVYARGNKADFDEWANQGNAGWSYKDVLPYFKKTEKIQTSDYERDYHGLRGELKVNYTKPDPLSYNAFIKSNIELGVQERDPNGKRQTGVSRLQWTIDFNKRLTGGSAFILPIINSTANLKVSLKSFVTKILFNKNKAVGVEFIKGGKRYKANAKKEVILSAGAINSPQILMLSGVGPSKDLTKLGIEVINDLPVGKYLKDHPVYMPLYIRTNMTAESLTLKEQVTRYLKGESPLTSVFAASPVSFINTKNLSSEVANMEIIFINPPLSVPGNSSMFYNLDSKHQQLFSNFNTLTDHLVYVINLKPKSVGSVTLKSKNPIDFPIIDPAYYTDAKGEDIQVVYEGIQYVLNLTKTNALKAINTTVVGVAPECESLKKKSERDYWFCAIKYLTSTLYHPGCTTRMGTSPNNSVVDSKLKVHRMQGLRVVDGGSMPELVSGHPFAAIFMMAEKVSDLIKQEYKVL